MKTVLNELKIYTLVLVHPTLSLKKNRTLNSVLFNLVQHSTRASVMSYTCSLVCTPTWLLFLSGVQSHHVQPGMTTNPFMNAAVTGGGFTFSPPCTALSSPFVSMNAGTSSSYPANIHSPYFGASPQSAGAVWSGNSSVFSFGGQQFPAATAAASASNPFLVRVYFFLLFNAKADRHTVKICFLEVLSISCAMMELLDSCVGIWKYVVGYPWNLDYVGQGN